MNYSTKDLLISAFLSLSYCAPVYANHVGEVGDSVGLNLVCDSLESTANAILAIQEGFGNGIEYISNSENGCASFMDTLGYRVTGEIYTKGPILKSISQVFDYHTYSFTIEGDYGKEWFSFIPYEKGTPSHKSSDEA